MASLRNLCPCLAQDPERLTPGVNLSKVINGHAMLRSIRLSRASQKTVVTSLLQSRG